MGCVQSTPNQTRRPTKIKKTPSKSRLSSKFLPSDAHLISDEERRNGHSPAYACPICFLYFSKILACSECKNFICFSCLKIYERKKRHNFQCPFCASVRSLFTDYELEAHSYFDTTNNGFLSKSQRKKVDEEIDHKKGSKLEPVNQGGEEVHG